MAFGADRSVKVNLQANVTDFIGKMTAAQKKTLDLGKDISRMSKTQQESWNKIGRGATIAGAGIVAALGGAAKAYMDFEAAMSGVAAVAGANATELNQLSEAALKAGEDTVFSASEAAKAQAELAKAGVEVSDILGGALLGSLDLAAAGQIGLAEAAEISAQAMNIFNLQGSDVAHIADVLTAGANKSAAGVDDLGMALAQGGLLAKQTGLSLEETVGALSSFADNALKGSDAGTSLKTMLQRLTPQTEAQADLMDQLGLRAYDAQGNFVGLATYAGKLQKALGGMSQEQRNAAMQTLFGSDAVRAANILYEEGASGVNTYVAAVNDIGAAQRMAARQTDNLKGDLDELKGSLESAFIRAGSGGNEGLRELVQAVTDLVNKFNELAPSTQANIVKIAAATAGALLLAAGAIKATTSVLALKASLDSAGISASKTGKGLATVGKVAGVAGASLAALAQADRALFDGPGAINARRLALEIERADSAMSAMNARILEAGEVADGFDSRIGSVEDALSAAFDPSHWQEVGDQLNQVFSVFGRENTSDVAVAGQRLGELDAALSQMVGSGRADQAAQAFFEITQAANAQGVSLADLQEKFPEYMAAADNAATSTGGFAESQTGLSENLQTVQDNAEDAAEAVDEYIKSLQNAGLVKLDTRNAERGFQKSIDDAAERIQKFKDLQKELKEAQAEPIKADKDGKIDADDVKRKAEGIARIRAEIAEYTKTLDINTEAGRGNQAAIDGVAKSALDLAQAIYDETGSEERYRESLLKSRTSLVETAQMFGYTKTEAEKFADSILNIPPAKTVTVKVEGLSSANQGLQTLKQNLKTLTGKTITITQRYVYDDPGKPGSPMVGGLTKHAATGGYITGPGSGTSDSIPAYLSNGEYVIKAAAVAKYGTTLFDQLNTMRFASGGFVGSGQSAMSSHTETTNAPVYIDKVIGPTLPDIEADAERRRRLSALRDM